MATLRKNIANQHFYVKLTDVADGSAVTSGSPTVTVDKDGAGSPGAIAGSIAHVSGGMWLVNPAQADTNADFLGFTVALSGAITVVANFVTTAANPHDAVRGGLSALPAAAADGAGGLPISDAGGLDLDALNTNVSDIETAVAGLNDASAGAIADAVWDEAAAGHVADGSFGLANQVLRAATAAAGASGSITLDASAPTTTDLFNGYIVAIVGGTGAGQARLITDYSSGRVASVAPDWAVTPDNTSKFVLRAAEPADIITLNSDRNRLLKFLEGAKGVLHGTVGASPTNTTMVVALTDGDSAQSSIDDFYKGRVVVFTSGSRQGEASEITAYAASTKTATFNALAGAGAPSSSDNFIIV